MKQKILIFCLVIFFLVVISPQTIAGSKTSITFAFKTDKPPLIDGVINEECWERALETGSFVCAGDTEKTADPQTSFKVIYDKEKIYFGIHAEEPDTSKLILKETARDGWSDGDSLEIFLDTNYDRLTYYQFAANLLGNQFDGYRKDKGKWNTDWDVAVKIDKESWSMEIGIKFSDLGISTPEKGAVWGLNVCRNTRGDLQYSSEWAEVGGSFHSPGKFNSLVFGSYTDWWNKESADFEKKSREFHRILSTFNPREEKLEQELAGIDDLRKGLSWEEKDSLSEGIGDFLVLYGQVQTLKEKYQEIEKKINLINDWR